MLTVRQATPQDAISLASRLRKEDLKELQAVGSLTPEESLLFGFTSPDPCYVAVDENDVPHILGGVYPSHDQFIGYVWLVASDALSDNWVWVLRNSKYWIERIQGHYKVLANVVHAENTLHIKWLRWAGFTVLREVKFNGELFYEFAKITNPEDI